MTNPHTMICAPHKPIFHGTYDNKTHLPRMRHVSVSMPSSVLFLKEHRYVFCARRQLAAQPGQRHWYVPDVRLVHRIKFTDDTKTFPSSHLKVSAKNDLVYDAVKLRV